MRYAKWLKTIMIFILAAALLASCGSDHTPALRRAESPSATQETEKTPPSDQGAALEEPEPDADQETFPASYIGKTVGDVVRDFGDEYIVEYLEGSTMIGYPDDLWFLFGTTVDTITDDLVIRQIMAAGRYPVVYDLTGSLTYSEIVEAVGGEADVPPSERYFDEIYQAWETFTEFSYREYHLSYSWENDTEEVPASFVHVYKLDVDSIVLGPETGSASAGDTSAAGSPAGNVKDDGAGQGSQDFFEGPGQFEGVMGCKFNVQEGFTQQSDEGLVRGPGMYRYSFYSDELDMRISVFECSFEALPIGAEDVPQEYRSASAAEGVTYTTSGEGYYVVSGYHGEESIYYTRVDYDEGFYTRLDFEYPSDNADACERVLLAFFVNADMKL